VLHGRPSLDCGSAMPPCSGFGCRGRWRRPAVPRAEQRYRRRRGWHGRSASSRSASPPQVPPGTPSRPPRPPASRTWVRPGRPTGREPRRESARVQREQLVRPRLGAWAAKRPRDQAQAAQWPVGERAQQEEGQRRAAPRVPGEGWAHSAAEASRVGRRTSRRRRTGCRDGRTECRAPSRRTDRRPQPDRPRRPTHPSGREAHRHA
jgi:hypothetical protein